MIILSKYKKQLVRRLFQLSKPFLSKVFPRVDFDSRWFTETNAGYLWCYKCFWQRNILRLAPAMPWPCALTCIVSNPDQISFHPDNLDNFQSPGTYFQCFKGKISLGKGCYIAPNVGIITVNHDPADLDKYMEAQDVNIGENVWIGMNSVVLPGVKLANSIIVGAGAVVTKSFNIEGSLLLGVPAKPYIRGG